MKLSIIPDIFRKVVKDIYFDTFKRFSYREKIYKLNKKYLNNLRLKGKILLLEINKEIIGYILFYERNNKSIHLDYVGIDTRYNGLGLSKYLFQYILENYKDYQITLECLNYLTDYYRKFGFKLYKSNFVSKYNKYNWNIMYINDKPNYSIIYNEFYNSSVEDIYIYIFTYVYVYHYFRHHSHYHFDWCINHYQCLGDYQ